MVVNYSTVEKKRYIKLQDIPKFEHDKMGSYNLPKLSQSRSYSTVNTKPIV